MTLSSRTSGNGRSQNQKLARLVTDRKGRFAVLNLSRTRVKTTDRSRERVSTRFPHHKDITSALIKAALASP